MSNEDVMFLRWLMLEKKVSNNDIINCTEETMKKLREEYKRSSLYT